MDIMTASIEEIDEYLEGYLVEESESYIRGVKRLLRQEKQAGPGADPGGAAKALEEAHEFAKRLADPTQKDAVIHFCQAYVKFTNGKSKEYPKFA